MSATVAQSLEPQSYLTYLRLDGEALAEAAGRAPTAHIASCPDWDMTALVGHVGGVHRWVNDIVSSRATEYTKRRSSPPEEFPAVLDWYREGRDQLVSTLEGTDPDEMVWNWRDRVAAPAAFWFRRMAHETAVHRWDGQAAAGDPQPVATELAVDGIDEFLSFLGGWLARSPVEGLQGSLHLHATDTDGEWSLDLRPDGVVHRREHAKSDVAVRGPVSDLLLWMLNRVPPEHESLKLFGDPALAERWRQLQF